MRGMREAVLAFSFARDEHLAKTVRQYRAKYQGVSQVRDEHPKVLAAVHEDLKRLSQGGRPGRRGDCTSETILRALVVHAIEDLSLRETVVRIAESEFLQDFLRTRKKAVMDHSFLPSMRQVVAQARRAQLERETVPASERVFRLFEPHTELIKRGRREKPVEFGHAVLLCQTPEKFISDYEVFDARPADCTLTHQVIERHEQRFGALPEVLAGDKGFCPDAEAYAALEQRVDTLAIPRRLQDFADKVLVAWQGFRAGIEGTISGLRRAFRLARCFYHGGKGFEGAMGLGVLAHNLVVLARQAMT